MHIRCSYWFITLYIIIHYQYSPARQYSIPLLSTCIIVDGYIASSMRHTWFGVRVCVWSNIILSHPLSYIWTLKTTPLFIGYRCHLFIAQSYCHDIFQPDSLKQRGIVALHTALPALCTIPIICLFVCLIFVVDCCMLHPTTCNHNHNMIYCLLPPLHAVFKQCNNIGTSLPPTLDGLVEEQNTIHWRAWRS